MMSKKARGLAQNEVDGNVGNIPCVTITDSRECERVSVSRMSNPVVLSIFCTKNILLNIQIE